MRVRVCACVRVCVCACAHVCAHEAATLDISRAAVVELELLTLNADSPDSSEILKYPGFRSKFFNVVPGFAQLASAGHVQISSPPRSMSRSSSCPLWQAV